ncbi:MAG: hypothetical protein WC926_00645 [Candidatus Paceibacterota bacterium]
MPSCSAHARFDISQVGAVQYDLTRDENGTGNIPYKVTISDKNGVEIKTTSGYEKIDGVYYWKVYGPSGEEIPEFSFLCWRN